MSARALEPYGTSIFAEMTRLANEHDALNLAQGFPDFDGPTEIIDAAVAALRGGANQYARSRGQPQLVRAISDCHERFYGLSWDPDSEVGVFAGATEGIAAAILGMVDPGDEVILLEPFYDSYPAMVQRAGGVPRYVTLRFPDFELPLAELEEKFSDRTRMLILNTPHNPTGKVFTREELELIARLCQRHDTVVLSDEVYEHITYDGVEHVPMATIDGMRERTLTLSSSGKTFSFTGWKIGWAIGPEPLTAAVRAAHQFLTFATATPLQHGAVAALGAPDEYYRGLLSDYRRKRDLLAEGLDALGFEVFLPEGTYFILADHRAFGAPDDVAFSKLLINKAGVAAIPPSAFYHRPSDGADLIRFAFCKDDATLREALDRMQALTT